MLDVQCHQCGTQMRLPDKWAGKQGRCPTCDSVLDIAAGGPPPVPPPAAAPAVAPPPLSPPESTAQATLAAEDRSPPALRRRGLPVRWLVAGAGAVVVLSLAAVLASVLGGGDDRDTLAGGNGPDQVGSPTVENGPSDPSPPDGELPATGVAVPAVPQGPIETDNGSSTGYHPPRAAITPTIDDPPLPGAGQGGLRGISGRYDDLQCQQIQARHAVRVPPAADLIEVDGQRLSVTNFQRLFESRSPYLFLPRGVHAVRFRAHERPVAVTIESDLFDEHQQMREFFGVGESIDDEALLERGARAMDVHGAPFLLNLSGAFYVSRQHLDVAERKFRRALCVNPMFAPAHLNLAICRYLRQDFDEAAREVELADAFNVGNVFGLAGPIAQARRKFKLSLDDRPVIDLADVSYVTTEHLDEEDRRLIALMEGISKYAVRPAERGKVLNNLAVHFADTGRPELALHHFRKALEVVRQAGPERFELATRILANMSDVCRKAGFAEAEEYEAMQDKVTP